MIRRRITLFLLFAIFLMANTLSAQDAVARLKKSYPYVMQEYGKRMSALKTDYIIAIDVSATMENHKGEVVPALTRFFDSIPDGNYVRIISFGENVKEELTELEINKQTRPRIAEKLNYVYDEVTKDRNMKNWTDFVLLGNKVADLIQEDNVADVHFLVVFSDLKDDPSRSVKAKESLKGRHRTNSEWQKLQNRFEVMRQNTNINTLSTYFSHNKAEDEVILESINLIKETFPGFEYSSDINEVLGNKLESSKEVIYTDKLKQLVREDVNAAGKKESFASQIGKNKKVSLKLSMDEKVPAFIKGVEIDTCILLEKSFGIAEVSFDAHAIVNKRNATRSIGKLKYDEMKLFSTVNAISYRVDYHFLFQEGKNEKSPSFTQDIVALGLMNDMPQKAQLSTSSDMVFVWDYWVIVVVGLLLLAFLILLIKNTIIPGRIRNKRLYYVNEAKQEGNYSIHSKRSFMIGDAKRCQTGDWTLPNAPFVVKVKARNGGPLKLLFKRKVMFYLEETPNVTMMQEGRGVTKANILKASIRINIGIGQYYEFKIMPLK